MEIFLTLKRMSTKNVYVKNLHLSSGSLKDDKQSIGDPRICSKHKPKIICRTDNTIIVTQLCHIMSPFDYIQL